MLSSWVGLKSIWDVWGQLGVYISKPTWSEHWWKWWGEIWCKDELRSIEMDTSRGICRGRTNVDLPRQKCGVSSMQGYLSDVTHPKDLPLHWGGCELYSPSSLHSTELFPVSVYPPSQKYWMTSPCSGSSSDSHEFLPFVISPGFSQVTTEELKWRPSTCILKQRTTGQHSCPTTKTMWDQRHYGCHWVGWGWGLEMVGGGYFEDKSTFQKPHCCMSHHLTLAVILSVANERKRQLCCVLQCFKQLFHYKIRRTLSTLEGNWVVSNRTNTLGSNTPIVIF